MLRAMIRPYVVRFVSPYANVGKTYIATHVIGKLKSKGYIIGVVKHCPHGLDIEGKDTHRYILSGADIVIASAKDVGIVYHRVWTDSLTTILQYVSTPIVIAEGFRGVNIGDAVVVLEDINDVEKIQDETNVIAYIAKNISKIAREGNVKIFTFNDVEALASLIENKALDHIYEQLPKADCGHCRYDHCKIFAEAYAKGLAQECLYRSDVRLIVNDKLMELNPFVKNMLKSLITGFINTLKGVPKNQKRILIEINME